MVDPMTPAPRARRPMLAPPQRMVARVVASFAFLMALFATRGAAASERLPGLDRVIDALATLPCAAAQVPSVCAGSKAAPDDDASILGAQSQPSAQARPQVQPEPDGKHVDDDGIVGGDVIALSAAAVARGESGGAAVRARRFREVVRVSGGMRAAHPVRGPPVSTV
jgi:hypothetical protein